MLFEYMSEDVLVETKGELLYIGEISFASFGFKFSSSMILSIESCLAIAVKNNMKPKFFTISNQRLLMASNIVQLSMLL